MPKNYYIVLGIPANSTDSDIKSAYRRLAKEYHPDYYGKSHSPFQDIQEAYSVLSNPSQRQQYDDSLNSIRIRRRGERYSEAPYSSSYVGAEPLVPERHQAEPLTPEAATMPRAMWPDFDSMFDQFFNTASLDWNDEGSISGYANMEVLLTANQAERGGHIRVHLPAQVGCPSCQGWIGGGSQECWQCFGTGYLRGEIPLLLSYPPGISNDHVVDFPLSRYGFSESFLRVRFKVADMTR